MRTASFQLQESILWYANEIKNVKAQDLIH